MVPLSSSVFYYISGFCGLLWSFPVTYKVTGLLNHPLSGDAMDTY